MKLTVDPRMIDPKKIAAICKVNPSSFTPYRRHSSSLRVVAKCSGVRGWAGNYLTYRNYID